MKKAAEAALSPRLRPTSSRKKMMADPDRASPKTSSPSVYRWLGRNWEPILALLAFAISAWSAWLGWQSAQLASAGLALARQSQLDQQAANAAAIRPYLSLVTDANELNVALYNEGSGVAIIYETTLYLPDGVVYVKPDHISEEYRAVAGSLVYNTWGAEKVHTIEANTPQWLRFDSPVGPLRSEKMLKLVELHPAVRTLITEGDLFDLMSAINIRVCFTDIANTTYEFTSGNDPRMLKDSCPARPMIGTLP